MLSLTRRTEYAVIALCYLARNPDRVCAAREIAERYHMPSALLMNVLKALSQGNVVASTRGARGGYKLGRPESEITLSQVIMAVEGPVYIVPCAGRHEDESLANESGTKVESCELMSCCPIKIPVQRIQSRLEALLNEITLADMNLAESEGECKQGVAVSVRGEHIGEKSREIPGDGDRAASEMN